MSMETRRIPTPLGNVWVRGEPEAFDGDKPVILVLLGFAAPVERFFVLQPAVPEAAVLIGHLPGNHSPRLADCSIGVFARAWSHVVATALAGRRLIVLGESLGGLVSLAMDVPNLRRLVLDPPFRSPTDPLFVSQCRSHLARHPGQADLAWKLLGVGPDTVEPRDFTHLIGRPARVLVGSRHAAVPSGAARSVVGEAERTRLIRAPAVWLTEVEAAGHVIAGAGGGNLVVAILREMLAAADHAPPS